MLAALAYLLFGLIYRSYLSREIPMSMAQRFAAAGLLLFVLGLTYVSHWARENLEKLMYLTVSLALSHLIYFSYINNYGLNYALSLVIVVIVVNFLFQGNLRLAWFNVAINAGVITSIFLAGPPSFNRLVYVCSFAAISGISFFLSSSKYRSRREYQQLFQDSPIGLVQCDRSGEIRDFNREMVRLAGDVSREKLQEVNIFRLTDLEPDSVEPVENAERRITFPWGKEVWVELSVELVPNRERPRDVIIALRDISSRKRAESRVEYVSYHDDLTDLYNRSFFDRELKRLKGESKYPISVVFIDLDKLKLVNDAFGHGVGDELLRKAAETIEASCRKKDRVFRWGGDEILILLPETTGEEARKVSRRIRRKAEEVELDPINLHLSLGHNTEEKSLEESEEFIAVAEEEMYENKIENSEKISNEILASITESLEAKSPAVIEHSSRVKELAVALGEELGLRDDQLENLELAAEYHDIGKVSFPEDLVRKDPRELEGEEVETLNGHPSMGYQISKELNGLNHVAKPILHHHEWWDGTGFPGGKQGEDIPYLARIIAVVNTYDFLTEPWSSGSEPLTGAEATEIIKDRTGSQFEPEIANTFLCLAK